VETPEELSHPRVFVLLPCYNEEKSIEELLERTSHVLGNIKFTIVAVDDGSTDGTLKLLERVRSIYPLVISRHQINMGLHVALHTGLMKIMEMSSLSDLVIVMDSDLTHDPIYIRDILSKLNEGFDVVIASRYTKGGRQIGLPIHRIVLSRVACSLMKHLFAFSVEDVTSGFRGYKTKTLKRIVRRYGKKFINSQGFEVMVELLIKAKKTGARITEIPILLDYSKKKNASKMRILNTVIGYARLAKKMYK